MNQQEITMTLGKRGNMFIEKMRKKWKQLYYEYCEGVVPIAFLGVIAGKLRECELPFHMIFRYEMDTNEYVLYDHTGLKIDAYDPVEVLLYGALLERAPRNEFIDRFDTEEFPNGNTSLGHVYTFLDIDVPAVDRFGRSIPTRGRCFMTISGKGYMRSVNITYKPTKNINMTVAVDDFITDQRSVDVLQRYIHRALLA